MLGASAIFIIRSLHRPAWRVQAAAEISRGQMEHVKRAATLHQHDRWLKVAGRRVIKMSISNTVRNRPVPVLCGLVVISLAGLILLPPFLRNQGYHGFADQRTLFAIPNFWNVSSNLPFIAVGAAGLLRLRPDPVTVLFAGIFLTGFGSSYYHLNPTDSTLFWDRLPMTLCFAAILAAVVQERVDTRAGVILLRPLLAAGVFSLLLWRWTDDLYYSMLGHNFFPYSHRSLCSNFSRRNIPAHSIGSSLRRFTRSPSCWSTMTTRFFPLDRF